MKFNKYFFILDFKIKLYTRVLRIMIISLLYNLFGLLHTVCVCQLFKQQRHKSGKYIRNTFTYYNLKTLDPCFDKMKSVTDFEKSMIFGGNY